MKLDPLNNEREKTLYVGHRARFPQAESMTPKEIANQEVKNLKEDMDEGYARKIEIARTRGFYQNLRFSLANQARRRATFLDCSVA